MSRFDKLMKLLRGTGDANFAFEDLRYNLEKLALMSAFAAAITSTTATISRSW